MRSTWTSSEVGGDLAAVDWAETPLGDPDAWPLSLKTAVRILLTSKFSMWMAWGPELTFFCNDSYRRDTLGKKYPWALGRPASEVWSEIWADISPRVATVMETGEATWDDSLQLLLERSGFVEETYHTFSYSPLSGDDGRIEGMLCVVSEVTEQVLSSRRLTTLRDLGARTTGRHTEDEAVAAAVEQIEADPLSLPFGLVYVLDPSGDRLVRAGCGGIDVDDPLAPETIVLADPSPIWPFATPLAGEQLLVDLTRLPHAAPVGPWQHPPVHALLVPLVGAASTDAYGFLVAGLSAVRPLDEAYLGFVDLFAGQLSAAITAARTFAGEKRRAETLARLDQAKTDFFTNVSHEFRTPLTLLLGPTSDALNDPNLPVGDPQRNRFEIVHRNGQRLLQLVNSLLDFSRLEAGGITSSFEVVDLPRVTEQLVMMFESAAQQAGIDLVLDCDAMSTDCYVDVEHWAKIVLNLVSNAFKFTFEGGITVTLRERDGHAVLTVSDTGAGIAADELPHLFERFHRGRNAVSRTHEGSGIGLALVSELARLHGGDVSASSTEGVGTDVVVTIPLGRAHLPAAEVADSSSPRGTGASEPPTALVSEAWQWLDPATDEASVPASPASEVVARILVVDDNADMRAYVADLLRDRYEVTTAADGLEALELIERDRPDLVVSDVMMPRLDGFGLLERLQADPRMTGIPVIMVSARAGEEGTVEGLEAGAADYLVKPFAARELLARVRVNLELDRVRRIRATLERSEALLDQAQRLARVGSWEVDLGKGTVTGSDELLRILGLTRRDFEQLGYPGVIAGVTHPGDAERVTAELSALDVGGVAAYDMRVVSPRGVERLVTVRAAMLGDDDGAPRMLQGSMQDITEQHAAEQALAEVRAREEAVQREHLIAEQLQRSMLPAESFDLDHLDVATYYRAGVEGTYVGGDWYDIIELDGGRIAFVMGDVMGRGVRAASVMGQMRSSVRAFATLDLPPDEVMRHLDVLVQDLAGDQIVTCVYAVHDPVEETVRYANAGHLPPLCAGRDGVVHRLTAGGPPLGAGYGDVPTEQVSLPPGATIVFYTDGLVEHRGQDIDEGIDALERHIDWHGTETLAGVPESVVGALLPDGPDDDVAILIARARGSVHEATMSMQRDTGRATVAEARQFVVGSLEHWDVPPAVVDDLALITSELVTNALVHGGAPVDLRLQHSGARVVLEVQDDAERQLPRARNPDDDEEHGRGIHIVEALSDEWGTRATDRGKCVWSARTWRSGAGGGSP
ncbi:SpoIIE family protein phosphatase [Aeromicrobium fastidiosum]|uniref:Protein-serine/threonine phosphatase n=1 Tax=Aeromicrobium fastidiosum TaxID=52699 RepID=A0A641AIR7_9ACTN|nr:SpoIIE family protein phosphatase [Aeromicrobium fastidiosum]KAA1374789.1 SpoIIE family protein phosphatase [Aeromicrobium fastidiosum]MBP2390660.1 PAS domain S-box-containing protein [Aeromicrobium fastidiosum]